MDLTVFVPVLALAVLVERLLETGINIIETNYKPIVDNETYGKNKQVITSLAGILLGIISAYLLGIRLFAVLELETVAMNALVDMIFTGAVAGALAPYSHQLIEAFFKLQKLLGTLQEVRERTESARLEVEAERTLPPSEVDETG